MKGLPPATRRCRELVEGSKGWSLFCFPLGRGGCEGEVVGVLYHG
jgi:hypothetical protein